MCPKAPYEEHQWNISVKTPIDDLAEVTRTAVPVDDEMQNPYGHVSTHRRLADTGASGGGGGEE